MNAYEFCLTTLLTVATSSYNRLYAYMPICLQCSILHLLLIFRIVPSVRGNQPVLSTSIYTTVLLIHYLSYQLEGRKEGIEYNRSKEWNLQAPLLQQFKTFIWVHFKTRPILTKCHLAALSLSLFLFLLYKSLIIQILPFITDCIRQYKHCVWIIFKAHTVTTQIHTYGSGKLKYTCFHFSLPSHPFPPRSPDIRYMQNEQICNMNKRSSKTSQEHTHIHTSV